MGILGLGIALVIIVIIGLIAFSQLYPEDFAEMFPAPPPAVYFFNGPDLTDSTITVDTSEILTVIARNNEDIDTVYNVVVKLSVIKGENYEEHLKFNEITPLSDAITPGDVSPEKNISITGIKVSGKDTEFTMIAEILVDGVTTDDYEFDIVVVPKS